ncbi:MAG: hypothetical protein P4L51_20155 [Puia sp.]|nr:hypothetical protein [Puia sp.]
MKTSIFSLIIAVALSVTSIHTASANNRITNDHSILKLAGEPSFKGSENFAKAFPDAMVNSYETKDGSTKVSFTWNGDALEAFYDLNGNLLATSHFMKTANLPMSVQMQVRDSYKDYSIVQAVEFYHTEKGLSYFVMVKKDNKGLILQINPDGGMSIVKRLKN